MSSAIQSTVAIPVVGGGTHLTVAAIKGAIETAFSLAGDPVLKSVRVRKEPAGYRAELILERAGCTPGEQRHWVIHQFLPRWSALEHQLGVRLYLRRDWV